MHSLNYPQQTFWYIAKNSEPLIFGFLTPEQSMTTPYELEYFDDEESWKNRLIELGISFEENIPQSEENNEV